MLTGRGTVVGALCRHLVDIVDRAEADRPRVHDIVDEFLAILARFALIGGNLVDAEILVMEGITGDAAIFVQHAGEHLDQDRLASARHAVADEGEEKTAEFDERVHLPVEVVGHQHLGELQRLVLGDVVADDLLGLLEGHHQRLALLPGRNVETVEREIVLVEPDVHALEILQTGETRLARNQPLDRDAGKGPGPCDQRELVRRTGNAAVETGNHGFQRILRRVEKEIRLCGIVHRLALSLQRRAEIGGKREGGDIGRSREKRFEMSRILAGKGRGGVTRLQLFKARLPREDIGNRHRHLDAAAGAIEYRMLRRRQERIGAANRLDGACEFDLAAAALTAGRDRRDETAPRSCQRCGGGAIVPLDNGKLGYQALRHRLMSGDLVLMQRRQPRVQCHGSDLAHHLVPDMTCTL